MAFRHDEPQRTGYRTGRPRTLDTDYEEAREHIDAQQGQRFPETAEEESEVRGPLPRDDREARQLLQLRRLEGADPLQQALVGQLALDRLDHVAANSNRDPEKAAWAANLATELRQRFNEISPARYHAFQEA
ncbi:MAG: hypothetical protein AAGF31_00815 [Planctomycetota bacterium]